MRKIISSWWLRWLLLAIYLINGIIYIPTQSITSDEPHHLNYAVRSVKGYPEKTKPFEDASMMPLTMLNTFPRVTEQLLHPNLKRTDYGNTDIMHGRYITLLVSLLIGVFVLRWSKELYGEKAELFSLFLFAFCPNMSAHAGLVTTDVYSALFTILPLYYFWKYTTTAKQKHFTWFAFFIGTAQVAKPSLTWLYLLFAMLFAVWLLSKKTPRRFNYRLFLKQAVLFLLINLLVLNVAFQFNHSGQSLKSYAFKSSFFNNIKINSGPMQILPLPLPAPYLYGLDYTKAIDEIGAGHFESSGKVYLLGESRKNKGFAYYYLVVLLFKTPLPLLLCTLASAILLIRKKGGTFVTNELYLLFPVVFFLVYFDIFYNSQVGLRHILMIFPLLFVFNGLLIQTIVSKRFFSIAISGIVLWSVITFYYFFPLLIPYTNELIWDKKEAYTIMADSNLDYNNADFYLKRYLVSHPGAHYATLDPKPGILLIRTVDLLDLYDTNKYLWLSKNFKPVGHLAFTYLVFNISEQDIKDKNLIRN